MFIVYDKDMNIKPFPKGVRPLDIFISSISKSRVTDRVEGSNGIITMGQTHLNRPIEVSVGLKAYDTMDYRLLRDETFSFFDDEVFYIFETYQAGKLYKVTTVNSYIPERFNQRIAKADFTLDVVDLPYGKSLGKTQKLHEKGIDSEGELWGFGLGLIDDDELQYTHTTKEFDIFNAGNVPIHPFEQDLKITISDIQGATEFLELKNLTNGTRFRVKEAVPDGHEIVIDGPSVTKNSLSYLRATSKEFIELSPSCNKFSLTGTDSATVSFDFHFYYL